MESKQLEQIANRFLQIINDIITKDFSEISEEDKEFSLENATFLQDSMNEFGLEVEKEIFGMKTKKIEHLSTILNTEEIFQIYKTSLYITELKKNRALIKNYIKKISEEQPSEEENSIMTDNREVFVIHGRNIKIRDSMFDFLRNLDLKPISFTEAKLRTGSGSPYNLEVIDKVITEDMKIISIMTPDDIAYMNPHFHKPTDSEREKTPSGQARLNVIFETGYAFAKNRDNIIIIVFGDNRIYSDIHGINLFYFQDTPEKRNELKEQLSAIGCPIGSGSSFLTCGDFELDSEILQNIPRTPNYTTTKQDIINSVKALKDLSVKSVRNEITTEIEEKFNDNILFIKKYPEVMAIMPDFITDETNSRSLHQIFKELGSYSTRVKKVVNKFELSLSTIRHMNI